MTQTTPINEADLEPHATAVKIRGDHHNSCLCLMLYLQCRTYL